MKKGQKVKHWDTGIWRQGVFEKSSSISTFGYVLFDDAKTAPDGSLETELVRLDELEEVKESTLKE